MDFVAIARYYTAGGFKIFPLVANGKVPVIKDGGGFRSATDDMAVIEGWSRDYPDCNIGIRTGEPSGVIVVDVDPRHGGNDSLNERAAKGFTLPRTATARTGNGGRHLFFRWMPGIQCGKNKLGDGVDIRSDGGYVVAPPSKLAPSDQGPGGQYKWLIRPDEIGFAPLPSWCIKALLAPKAKPLPKFEKVTTTEAATKSLEGMAQRVARAPQGERNNVLNWAAYNAGGLIKSRRISQAYVEQRLTQAALATGLDKTSIEKTIRSGLRGAFK